jgi:DNA-binding XRE family transcriptional regulator
VLECAPPDDTLLTIAEQRWIDRFTAAGTGVYNTRLRARRGRQHTRALRVSGLRVARLRFRKALTQQELADKAGITRATLSRLEAGAENPYPSTVRKLAAALGVQPDALMEPEGSGAP